MLANGKMDVCLNVQTAVDSRHKMVAAFDVINQAQDKNQMNPWRTRRHKLWRRMDF